MKLIILQSWLKLTVINQSYYWSEASGFTCLWRCIRMICNLASNMSYQQNDQPQIWIIKLNFVMSLIKHKCSLREYGHIHMCFSSIYKPKHGINKISNFRQYEEYPMCFSKACDQNLKFLSYIHRCKNIWFWSIFIHKLRIRNE